MLQVSTSVKVNTCLATTFKKNIIVNDDDGDDGDGDNSDDNDPNRGGLRRELQDLYFQTNNITVGRKTNLRGVYEKYVTSAILKQIDDAITQGSGFSLHAIKELVVQVNRHDPLRGSSYIKTPKFLADKRAIVNVQNKDNKCFMWTILSALHYKKTRKIANV